MFLKYLNLLFIFNYIGLFNMYVTSTHHYIELSAFHICPILQIIEQNFAINDSIYLNNTYLIEDDSLYTLKANNVSYIKSKVQIITKSEYKNLSFCELSLICKISEIKRNEYGDLNIKMSFQIYGHKSNIMGFLDIKYERKNDDVLPIYRLLHYSTFDSE